MYEFIIPAIIVIVVFILARQLMTWYFRIDIRVRLLEENNKLLTMLVAHTLGISETEVENKAKSTVRGVFMDKVPDKVTT